MIGYKKWFSIARAWQVATLSSVVTWVTKQTTLYNAFIQLFINFICLIQLLWNEIQLLISYPGKEQYNFPTLNSAKEAKHNKVTSLSSTLELTRYRLLSQRMFWATASLKHQLHKSMARVHLPDQFQVDNSLWLSCHCSISLFPDSAFEILFGTEFKAHLSRGLNITRCLMIVKKGFAYELQKLIKSAMKWFRENVYVCMYARCGQI